MGFHVQITNYQVIQSVDFNPDGVCLIVGPNGCGKTTLLSAIELLRNTFERGFNSALALSGGTSNLTHFNLSKDTPTKLAIETANLRWEISPIFNSKGPLYPIPEKLIQGDSIQFTVESGQSQFKYGQFEFMANEQVSALKRVDDSLPAHEFESLIQPLKHYYHYGHYDLWTLRHFGSHIGSENALHSNGKNAFSVLRNWRDSESHRERYEFVIDVLQEMFPSFFEDIDFQSTEQSVSLRLVLPSKKSVPISATSHGFLNALLHLIAVCSVPDGGILGIDEPEHCLHPYAIQTLIEAFRDRAEEHLMTMLLATHSPLILNEFKEEPQRVYVMEENQSEQIIRLDKLKEPNWIKQFRLGDLYGKEFARMGD
jgi:predicted ATPase